MESLSRISRRAARRSKSHPYLQSGWDFSASSSSEVWSLRSFPASSSEVYNNATSYRSRQAILASLCFVQDIKRIIGDFDRRSLTGRHSKTRLILACCHTTAVKVSRGATETAPPPKCLLAGKWEPLIPSVSVTRGNKNVMYATLKAGGRFVFLRSRPF